MAAPSATLLSASPRFLAPHTKGDVNLRLSMWFSASAGVSTEKIKVETINHKEARKPTHAETVDIKSEKSR